MRIQAVVSYDGSKFYGMQKQPHKKTVQDNFEFALKCLNINPKINYAGRTDTGVHALNQSIDFEIPEYWSDTKKLKKALNKIFSDGYIQVKFIRIVNNDFHSRFYATKRSYRYLITDRLTPFNKDYTLFKPNLNFEKISNTIKIFEGEHNFEYFKKNGSDTKNYIRKIFKSEVIKYKNFVIIRFVGNGFLRSQVRMMVGALLSISDNRISKEDLINQLNREKRLKIPLASANGLYFERAFYEKNINHRR